jgi:hypothetical protein
MDALSVIAQTAHIFSEIIVWSVADHGAPDKSPNKRRGVHLTTSPLFVLQTPHTRALDK